MMSPSWAPFPPCSSGLTGFMIFVCLLIHGGAAKVAWDRFRRAIRQGNQKNLLTQELADVRQRRSFAFLCLIWLWFLYLLHTHWCAPASPPLPFVSSLSHTHCHSQ